MDDRVRAQSGVVEGGVVDGVQREPFKVAIIADDAGGMFTAWRLPAKADPSRQITVFEASDCLAGKIHGKIILDLDNLSHTIGDRARDEARSFRERGAGLLSPQAVYFSMAKEDAAYPPRRSLGENRGAARAARPMVRRSGKSPLLRPRTGVEDRTVEPR